MGLFNNFPWTNLHELNLQWIVETLKKCYSPDNPPEAMVISVNGESGNVVLYKDAVIRFPDVQDTQWNLWRNTDGVSTGIQFEKGQPAKRIDGQNRIVIYDANNPPPYPVVSVNGLTGEIELYSEAYVEFPDIDADNWGIQRKVNKNTPNEATVGIMFDDSGKAMIIHNESSNEIYSEDNPPPYPVTSVDGNTGNVHTWAYNNTANLTMPVASPTNDWTLTRNTNAGELSIQLLYNNSTHAVESYVVFDDGVNPPIPVKLLTLNDIPSSSGVVSFNGLTGAITITGADLDISTTDTTKIATAINNINTSISQIIANIAIPQNGNTATQNIATGEFIYWNGGIYRAIADIETDDPIIDDPNNTPNVINIQNGLLNYLTKEETGDITFNSSYIASSSLKYKRICNMVCVTGAFTVSIADVPGFTVIFTLPQDAKPFEDLSVFTHGYQTNVPATWLLCNHLSGNVVTQEMGLEHGRTYYVTMFYMV